MPSPRVAGPFASSGLSRGEFYEYLGRRLLLSGTDRDILVFLTVMNFFPGSWRLALQILAGFLTLFCTIGLGHAFGVFHAYYEDELLVSYSPSAIAWIGTVQGFLVEVFGLVSGPLYDRGHFLILAYAGALLNVAALVAASFATEYYSAFLSLGICFGLGAGMLYVPSLAALAVSFTAEQRPLATGISATGIGIGGVVYPLLFRAVIDEYGFPCTCIVLACLNALLLGISCVLFQLTTGRPKTDDKSELTDDTSKLTDGMTELTDGISELTDDATCGKTKGHFDFGALRDIKFLLFCIAMFFLSLAVDVPYLFLPGLVAERGYTAQVADDLLSAMNASSIIGRVLLGVFAVYAGTLRVWQAAMTVTCVLLACWGSRVGGLPGTVVFTVLYGFCTGVVVALFAPVLLSISPNLDVVGSRLGLSSLLAGLGYLIGPPIAGALQRTTIDGYTAQAAFSSSAFFVAVAAMALVSWRQRLPAEVIRAEPSKSQGSQGDFEKQ